MNVGPLIWERLLNFAQNAAPRGLGYNYSLSLDSFICTKAAAIFLFDCRDMFAKVKAKTKRKTVNLVYKENQCGSNIMLLCCFL